MSSKSDDPSPELNDQEFNEYLRRGSGISQQYSDLPSRDVPPLLEQRILQQARTARAARKSATPRWVQWGAPLAVAASMLLAVTVLLRTTPEDRAVQIPPAPRAANEPTIAENQEAVTTALPERSKMPSERLRDTAPQRSLSTSRQTAPAGAGTARPLAAAPPVLTSAPPPSANADSAENARQRRERNDDEAKATAPAPAPPADEPRESDRAAESSYAATERTEPEAQLVKAPPAAKREQRMPAEQPLNGILSATSLPASLPPDPQVLADRKVAPEDFLEQLRVLRAEGKTEEANALLKRLRAAHPQFQVPVEDQPPP